MINTIGLFGTCGNSTWRDKFVAKYTELSVPFFNPQLAEGEWHPGCVRYENANLMYNCIVLFPILSETTAQGSLAEVGFSIQAALHRNPDRYFIFLIDDECTDPNASNDSISDSNRCRALVKSKIASIQGNSGIFVVSTLNEMLLLSEQLYAHIQNFNKLRNAFMINE